MRPFDALADLRADVVYSWRLLIKSPVFTLVAVSALALGIGANATVFTLANAYLFKNLPFDDSARILYVSSTNVSRPGVARPASYPDFLDLQARVKSFEGLAAFSARSVDVSDKNGFPERYRCPLMSANGFALIGQRPVLGRDFRPEDEQSGTEPVAILSYGLWERRYGKDPDVLGKTIRVNDVPTVVVGVMPRGLIFAGASELWMPLTRAGEWRRRDARTLTLFGRLAKGASLASARTELQGVARQLTSEYPDTNKTVGVLVQNFNDRFSGGQTRLLFLALLGAVGFVLLIACANVANLLLARAVARSREICFRAALGAGRWRIIRQLLVESVMLSVAAGLLGMLLSIGGVRVFDSALIPTVKPAYVDFSMDRTVVAYLVAITLGTGILFGLAPALQLSRLDISTLIREGGGGAGRGLHQRFLTGLLVISEVSLAIVLLTGAGLMIRSFWNTTRAEIGVSTDNVLSLELSLRATTYPRPEDQLRFHDRLKERLDSLPGIEVATIASDLPAESPDTYAYEIEGGESASTEGGNDDRPEVNGLIIGKDFFRALHVKLQSGRSFSDADIAGGIPVVIVNQAFVRAAWPRQDAIGKRLRLILRPPGAPRNAPPTPQAWLNVVGVVPDILQDDESFELGPVLYLPVRQHPQSGMMVVIRTRVPPATLGDTIRREVAAIDEGLAVRSLLTLEDSLWLRNWRQRVFGSMFAIFAAIALVLASLGLYAVMAHSVSQRVREIGVRMALGAAAGDILGLVFKHGMWQLAIGMVVGLSAAFGVTRVLSALLIGVTPADPLTFAGAGLVLALAGVLGCAIPAGYAMRVDPVVALRND